MRVRTGKIIKATSLLGQLNIPTIISKSTAASMIVEKKSNAGDFRFGEGINTGQGIFNIISGHIYFFYLKVKNLTPTNTQNRRFSIWDKTADQYVAWIDTTNLNDIEYIANWTATRSSLIYSCFSFQYASNVDNPSCEPELYIAIDLTEIFGSGNELTAQQFYTKYKDKLELLATGEEIVLDSKTGRVNLCPRLPSTYQEVEYIQSALTIRINSNYYPKLNKTKVVADAIKEPGHSIFGSGYHDFVFTGATSSNVHYAYYNNTKIETNQSFNTRHLYILDKNNLYIDDTLYGSATLSTATCQYPLGIFGRYVDFEHEGNEDTGVHTLYSLKIYEDDKLVRSFIPCYRKSDNEIGLFEVIEQEFYTLDPDTPDYSSATFIKGNNVNTIQACNVTEKMYGYNQLMGSWYSNANGIICNECEITIPIGNYAFGQPICNFDIPAGDKVYYKIEYLSGMKSSNTIAIGGYHYNSNPKSWQGVGTINSNEYNNVSLSGLKFENITTLTNSADSIYLFLNNTTPVTEEIKVKINYIDLTWWYGPGKEPTTVAEFKEKFSKDYYGYCPNKIMLTQGMINALPEYGYNQVVQNGDFANISIWVYGSTQYTVSNNTATLIPTYQNALLYQRAQIIKDHCYLGLIDAKMDNYAANKVKALQIYNGSGWLVVTIDDANWKTYSLFFTGLADSNNSDTFRILQDNRTSGFSNTYARNAMFIDLTDWYGAGNEPTTVAEFKATFPHKYYPYMKKSILNRYQINGLGVN